MNNKFQKHISMRERGAALLTMVILFMLGSLIVTIGISRTSLHDITRNRTLLESKQSFFAVESSVEDVVFRLMAGKNVSTAEVLDMDGAIATTTLTTLIDQKQISSVGDDSGAIRKLGVTLDLGTGSSFIYGLQSHTGGIYLENSSAVRGNVYSNGPVVGFNNNMVYGDVVSAGPSGYVFEIHATGTVWSHDIENSYIEGDAYWWTGGGDPSGTTILGTKYHPKPDQPISALSISDEVIEQWEADAEAAGSTTTCPYVISSDVTLGPEKIECSDVTITGNPTITLEGVLWIEGTLTITNQPTIIASSSLGQKSVQVIVDDPSDRANSSQIDIRNSTTFVGAGDDGYVLLIAMNDGAENGSSTPAIILEQSSSGDVLLYAPHGEILVKNNTHLREASGYKLHLQNSAEVIYETGLTSILFDAGPGGGYVISSWGEVE